MDDLQLSALRRCRATVSTALCRQTPGEDGMPRVWRGAALGPTTGMHSLYLLYTQFIAMLAVFPMIWAYTLGRWFWLTAIWALVSALCWLPSMIRHARSRICRATPDPNRSYARRRP
jgi:hypothetical protein